jgi:hypothetical protein
MQHRSLSLIRGAGAVVLALTLAGACGSASRPEVTPSTAGTEPAATTVDTPSISTRMICADEAGDDIATTLGMKPLHAPIPTWVDHLYSCRYVYPTGFFTLSVRQLDSRAATTAYFDATRTQLGFRMKLDGLGQGAFTTPNGSVVVEKDDKVLLVDDRNLPARFGVPDDTRANAALSIAATIMGCWTGA